MTNGSGQIIYQYRQDTAKTGILSKNPLVKNVLDTQHPIAGTVVLNVEQLLFENPSLAAQADMAANSGPEEKSAGIDQ